MKRWKDLDGTSLTKAEIIRLLKSGFHISMTTGTLRHGHDPVYGANLCNDESRDNYKLDYELTNDIIRDEKLRYIGNKPFRGSGVNVNQMRYEYGETTALDVQRESMDLLRAMTFNR